MSCKEELEERFPYVTFYGPTSINENVVIGEGTGIGEYCVIGPYVTIGKNCSIMYHVSIPRGTCIGDDVFIGPNVTILNDKYPPSANKAPTIKNKAVIGGGAVVLPDITVGYRAVVAGGSVVTTDVPSERVVAGNPARVVLSRDEYDMKQKEWVKYCPERK